MNNCRESSFWEKVNVRDNDECWEWKAATLQSGYGRFWDGNRDIRAHRYSWELYNKRKIPKGMLICHHCDNPPCCNPKHLFLGTQKDNMRDMVEKGRYKGPMLSGENHILSKLTKNEVIRIRNLYATGNYSQRGLAKLFKISKAQIHRIVNNLRWKHI